MFRLGVSKLSYRSERQSCWSLCQSSQVANRGVQKLEVRRIDHSRQLAVRKLEQPPNGNRLGCSIRWQPVWRWNSNKAGRWQTEHVLQRGNSHSTIIQGPVLDPASPDYNSRDTTLERPNAEWLARCEVTSATIEDDLVTFQA